MKLLKSVILSFIIFFYFFDHAMEKEGKEQNKYRRLSIILGEDNLPLAKDYDDKMGAMSRDLSQLLIQQACPILINAKLFTEFFTFKKVCMDERVKRRLERTKTQPKRWRVGFEQIVYQIPFTQENWYAFDCKNTQFVLLMPKKYLQYFLGYSNLQLTPQEEEKLGFKMRSFDQLSVPETNQDDNVISALGKTLQQIAYKRDITFNIEDLKKIFMSFKEIKEDKMWNVYLTGHGLSNVSIAGVKINEFQSLLQFFNKHILTHLLYYVTCFGGGEHLIESYKPFTGRYMLNYIVVSGATTTATVTASWPGKVRESAEAYGMFLPKIYTFFDKFYESLEAEKSLQITLSYVADLHFPAKHIPLVRFRGTDWFSAIDINKKIEIINNVRTLTHLIDQKPFIVEEKAAVLIYPSAIPVPLVINNKKNIEIIMMAPDGMHNVSSLSVYDWRSFIEDSFTDFGTVFSQSKFMLVDELKVNNKGKTYKVTLRFKEDVTERFQSNIVIKDSKIIFKDSVIVIKSDEFGPIASADVFIKDDNNNYYSCYLTFKDDGILISVKSIDDESSKFKEEFETLLKKYEEFKKEKEELFKKAKALGKIRILRGR